MSKSVYDYIRDALIEWRPYDDITGVGYDSSNVRDVVTGGITGMDRLSFDYVYVDEVGRVDSGLTTGSNRTKSSTRTYTIDCYTKRNPATLQGKRATLKASKENIEFISNLLTSQGFSVTVGFADYDYSGNGTNRRTLTATRTFITN